MRGLIAPECRIDVQEKLAASYGRKSDADSEGLKSQHLRNEERARHDGYQIPRTVDYRFEDDDTTGITKRRSGFDRLVQLVTSGEAPFTRVYVKDRTRLGRWTDPRYGVFLGVLFEEHGVKLVFSEDEEHPDYSEFSPHMLGHFVKEVFGGVVASEERSRLIRRVTEGMRYWAMRGFFPGSTPPYGLERWLADEKTGVLLERVPDGQAVRRAGCRFKLLWAEDGSREVIRAVFRLIEQGRSLRAVAHELEDRGAPTSSRQGRWRSEMVRRIARNPIYCGDLVWGRSTREGEAVEQAELGGKEAVLLRDFLPDAPVTREQWEDVQRILDGNRERWQQRRSSAPEYLLSGLVTCGGCGAGWHGYTSTRQAKSRRRYYRHGNTPEGVARCAGENRYVSSEALESHVVRTLMDVLRGDRLARLTEEAIEERLRATKSTDHEKQIVDTERQIVRYQEAVRRLTRESALAETETSRRVAREEAERFGREADHLQVQLRALTAERDQLEELSRRRATLTTRSGDLLHLLHSGAPGDRKELVAEVIHHVEVDPHVTQATVAVRSL